MQDRIVTFRNTEYDAPKLLVALYERAPITATLGTLDAPSSFTEERALRMIEQRKCFDFEYVFGRPIKVRARGGVIDELSRTLYNRDAGEGAFECCLTAAKLASV